MPPPVFDLDMTRGDTPEWDLSVTRSGQPFDLTDWELRMTAKFSVADADPGVFQLEIDSGIEIVNAAEGQVTIQPFRESTASLPAEDKTLVYDIQASNDTLGKTHTLCRGKLTVLADVTRTT